MRDPSAVRCRPHPAIWFFILILLGVATVPLWGKPDPPRAQPDPALDLLLGGLFAIPAAVLALWSFTGAIIADAEGLRWRFWFRWRHIPWSGVTDYGEVLTSRRSRRISQMDVRTTAGNLRILDVWTRLPALRDAIQERATSARARSWGVLGARPEDDWPRVFAYDVRRLRRDLFTMYGSVLLGLATVLSVMGPRFAHTIRTVGWGAGLGRIGLALFVPVSMSVLVCLTALPLREGLRRTRQRIIVDPDGITYEDESHRIESPWADVSGVRTATMGGLVQVPARWIFETRHGTFDAVALSDRALLRVIVQRFAPHAEWREDSRERLAPSAPAEEAGVRVYTYRNRTVRALLWFPTALSIITLGIAALAQHGVVERDATTGFVLGGAVGAFALWGWWRFYTVSVRTDAIGITWSGPGRQRFIAWPDVRDLKMRSADIATYAIVRGPTERIAIWMGISDFEVLQAEIRERSPALRGEAPAATRR